MAYQIIFFDLDGTLIDAGDSITKSVQYTLSKFGIKTDFKNLTHFIGPPLNESLKKHYNFNEEQSRMAGHYYREHFLENGIKELTPYEGAVDMLKKLKEKNKTLAIVSTKFRVSVEKILKEHNLTKYFDAVFATLPDESNASKVALVKEALSFYPNNPKDSFVMVGDTKFDIIGAQTNGIDSIGVLYGYGYEKEVKNTKPTYVIKNISELTELFIKDHV